MDIWQLMEMYAKYGAWVVSLAAVTALDVMCCMAAPECDEWGPWVAIAGLTIIGIGMWGATIHWIIVQLTG